MSDEGISSGLGSLALYELGRGDERFRQRNANFVSSLTAQLRGQAPVDVQALLFEIQTLQNENAILWSNNGILRGNLTRFSANIGQLIDACGLLERKVAALEADKSWLARKITALEAAKSWLARKVAMLEGDLKHDAEQRQDGR